MIVGLADPRADEVSLVGAKFAGLARAARAARVPAAVCVSVDEHAAAVGPGRVERLRRALDDARATVGAFIGEADAEARAALEGVRVGAPLRAALATALATLGGERARLAVRSSALDEDGETSSRAGVYESVLDVRGLDAVCAAVERCWCSYYGPAAIAARVRASDFDPAPRMAVIVQALVEPQLAGVAFTEGDGGAAIEYVEGRGDALVSGTAAAHAARVRGGALPPGSPPALAAVARAALELRSRAGRDVDVEWAWDASGLWVLQARPVTAPPRARGGAEPYFASARLYLDDELPPGFELGEVAGVYAGYVAKRAPAHRLAVESGIAVGAAHVVCADGRALLGDGGRERLAALLEASPAADVVLDLGDALRQVVVSKDRAHERVATLAGLRRDGRERRAFVVRDFIRGSVGVISHPVGGGGVLVESSEDGLLHLNRGTGTGLRMRVRDAALALEGANVEGALHRAAMPALADVVRFTQRLNERLPGTQLEWVVEDGRAVFVDFSRVGAGGALGLDAGRVVSPGAVRGPVLRLDDDELLARLSIGPAVSVDRADDALAHGALAALIERVAGLERPPIVLARRPYAVLSTLLDHVAGFVFEQGSTLCHLGILVREAGVPAVICEYPPFGDEALIADGHVTVFGEEVPA